MKRVLIYGDSNTWGQMAFSGRYAEVKQWPNILQDIFGDSFRIVQAGVGGRIAGSHNRERPELNGRDAFLVSYLTAYPVNLVVIALGTNDIKEKYNLTVREIYDDLVWYARAVETYQKLDEKKLGRETGTKILYLLPPNIIESKRPEFRENIRLELTEIFADSENPHLLINDLELTDDGVHFSERDHEKVAQAVGNMIKEINI